jgi:hypothetical protein
MKKIAILTILAAGVAFTACKKDKTCECTMTSTSGSTTTTSPVDVIEIKDIKGGEAKSWCQKSSGTSTSGTVTSSWTNDCKLK